MPGIGVGMDLMSLISPCWPSLQSPVVAVEPSQYMQARTKKLSPDSADKIVDGGVGGNSFTNTLF